MRLFVAAAMAAASISGCAKKNTAALPDDMSLGPANSKVTVVEYASVGCPVCGRWDREVWPAFKAKYVDTGRVRYTFREMLVGSGVEVQLAAAGFLLARCSDGKYFQVIDAIFRRQDEAYQDPRGVLLDIAKSEGMTEPQFDKCVSDENSLNALQKRVTDNATEGGVNSTPTFVINGKVLEPPGYHPLSDLDAAIASAQAAAK